MPSFPFDDFWETEPRFVDSKWVTVSQPDGTSYDGIETVKWAIGMDKAIGMDGVIGTDEAIRMDGVIGIDGAVRIDGTAGGRY